MAVCNLFNDLESASGNFLMFSQYVEDLTRNNSDGDNWKVVPSKFIALNIDYSKFNNPKNNKIPEYFQNYYENGCAFGKNNPEELLDNEWNPEYAKNFFWYSMGENGLITITDRIQDENNTKSSVGYIKEVVYCGDINMHSYNEHQGMGYSEIYCYIPSDSKKTSIQLSITNELKTEVSNKNKSSLEGFDNIEIGEYNKPYCYNEVYSLDYSNKKTYNDNKYDINTVIVLYSIYVKNETDNDWNVEYENIPMGMYITGNFDDSGNITNNITKHVTTSYDSGTSYGLRICSRFSATTTNGKIITDITTDNSEVGYSNMCQLMTKMNENLYEMKGVSISVGKSIQDYKEYLISIKLNRVNVPYVRTINGEEFWFINGRLVSSTKNSSFIPINSNIIDSLDYNFTWNN